MNAADDRIIQAFERIATILRNLRIFVVGVGEMESFVRSVANHGPRWVNEVLKKDLSKDSELEGPRQFVASLQR